MELQIINGTFSSTESIEILSQLFQVKIKFHEDKIRTSQNEEDVKMRERKIIALQKGLADSREYILKNANNITINSTINL
jgi:hypothetical protein